MAATRQLSPAMAPAAQKWRSLAERRRAHFLDLYRTGRWKHYYTNEEFLAGLREAITLANRWAKLAPTSDEVQKAS
jgi:uncharacterized repeat protein (TIGR03809 family)